MKWSIINFPGGTIALLVRLFVWQKKLLQFFRKKDYKIQKILKNINFSSPFLFVTDFESNESLLLLFSGTWVQHRQFCNQIDYIRGGQSVARKPQEAF